jgi:hypothetical protein
MPSTSFLPTGLDKPGSTTLPRGSALCGSCSRVRQCVTPFVVRLAGMSTNVHPCHVVVADELIELLPKILVYGDVNLVSTRRNTAMGPLFETLCCGVRRNFDAMCC